MKEIPSNIVSKRRAYELSRLISSGQRDIVHNLPHTHLINIVSEQGAFA